MKLKLADLVCTPDRNQLEGPARRLKLEPLLIKVLLCLSEHAGTVVSKDTLLAVAWNGRVVSDAALTGTISQLRKALSDAGTHRVCIQTHSKIGYSLEVRADSATGSLPAARYRPWLLLCTALAVAAGYWAFEESSSTPPSGVAVKWSFTTPDGMTSGGNIRGSLDEAFGIGNFSRDGVEVFGEITAVNVDGYAMTMVLRSQTRWEQRLLRLPFRKPVRMSFEPASGSLPYEITLLIVPVYETPE